MKETKFVSLESPFEVLEPVKPAKSVFQERLRKMILYLWDDQTGTLIKSIPKEGKYMAKIPPSGKEFEIAYDTDPVVRAVASEWEVTKKEYDNNKVPAGAS